VKRIQIDILLHYITYKECKLVIGLYNSSSVHFGFLSVCLVIPSMVIVFGKRSNVASPE